MRSSAILELIVVKDEAIVTIGCKEGWSTRLRVVRHENSNIKYKKKKNTKTS